MFSPRRRTRATLNIIIMHVCHLHHSLYRQAPRARFSRLSSQLLNYGFTGNQNNISLFIYRQESTIIFVLIYVIDIILIGSSSKAINNVINYLRNDLGQLIFFLGVEASHCSNDIHLTPQRYINDLLIRFGMD